MLAQIREKIDSTGDKSYVIHRGGTQPDAIFSYIDIFEEMLAQKEFSKITDIFVTSGSGGTVASLGIAAKLSNSKIRIHGNRIWGKKSDFESIYKSEIEGIGLD